MSHAGRRQRGAALVTAIFLVVVLAALGAYMITLSGVEQVTVSRIATTARVYFGAKAGLEWAIHQAVAPGADNEDETLGACSPAAGFSLTGAGFQGVSVAVTCSSVIYNGNDDYRVFTLTSTATYGSSGTIDHVERKLQAVVCRSNDNGGGTGSRC